MEFSRYLEGADEIEIFDDSGEIAGADIGVFKIVHAAKNKRDSLKEGLSVFNDEVIGMIVGDDDDIELFMLEFFTIEFEETGIDGIVEILFGIHIFYLQINLIYRISQNFADAFEYFIGPLIAMVLGVDVENIFLYFGTAT